MDKKTEKREIAAANPLVSTGVEKMILVIRGKLVLFDRDLATLYGVETKVLNQAVKRNIERFLERNCFQLTELEFTNCKSPMGAGQEKYHTPLQSKGLLCSLLYCIARLRFAYRFKLWMHL